MKKTDHHYSGDRSTGFWKRVNALHSSADHAVAYSLGCVLQNLETYVLQQLANSERAAQAAAKRKSQRGT